jgi:hypothetical protein
VIRPSFMWLSVTETTAAQQCAAPDGNSAALHCRRRARSLAGERLGSAGYLSFDSHGANVMSLVNVLTVVLASVGYAAGAGFVWTMLDHTCATVSISRMSVFVPTIALSSGGATLLQFLARFTRKTEARRDLMFFAAIPIASTFSFLAAVMTVLFATKGLPIWR